MRTALVLASLLLPQAYAATAPAPIQVFTEKASAHSIFNILTYPARVESRVNAVVRSESDGAITKILRPLGSKVRRGEVIAVIKHMDPVYEYAPLNVIASVSGVINEVNVTLGSLVNRGDPIASITDPKQLRVIVEVAAVDLRSVQDGLKGSLKIPGIPDSITAEIQGISPSVDPMLGTATCELKVASADQKKILPGMVGSVQFKVNQRRGFLLPEYAVIYNGDETYIRLVENGKAKRVPVKIGEKRQGQVEILSGLKEGDQVIDRAARFLADGDAIQVETTHE